MKFVKKKNLSDEELLSIAGGDDGNAGDDCGGTKTLSCPNCDYEMTTIETDCTAQFCPNCHVALNEFEC